MKIAAIHVDPQNGFSIKCPLELAVAGALGIIKTLNKMFAFADVNIVSQDWHPDDAMYHATEDKPMGTAINLPNADVTWNRHCVANTFGAELIKGLPKLAEFDLAIRKGEESDCHPYGALWHDYGKTRSTGIIEFLEDQNVTDVLVGGLALDFCVRETVLELVAAGFKPVLVLDATRPVFEEKVEDTIAELVSVGATVVQTLEDAQLHFKKAA
ncbi:isochorismatase family protein [Vibrio coralliirubri]|uniref:isochorismatase family protein n=1 Tax=Vibrio coralliirubri TaxID=1516159 RepID=UPI00228389F9|nr:isochorismatase family protein [Vibrio coralliirubri]MCY9861196.1 isochorismatase family protein [Vibrio coralliirubri]